MIFCFGVGAAFFVGTFNEIADPISQGQAWIPAMLAAMFLLGAFLLFRRGTATNENPFRALNPTAFDKGERINQRARELQRVAGKGLKGLNGLSEGGIITAIGTALGNEIAALVRRHPSLSMDDMLQTACDDVHEAAYIAAGLPLNNKNNAETPEATRMRSTIGKLVKIVFEDSNPAEVQASAYASSSAVGFVVGFAAAKLGGSFEQFLEWCRDGFEKGAKQSHRSHSR